MKYIITLIILLFASCKNQKTSEVIINEYSVLDSVITKSQENLNIANNANKKSDSLVTGKIDQTVKKSIKL